MVWRKGKMLIERMEYDTTFVTVSLIIIRNNYRMAKAAKRLNAILDYMRKVKSSISMVFGLVF